jgi:2-desacetyl-2-hydroxyethyl bacteriochlorophyllide A dehydrogenase
MTLMRRVIVSSPGQVEVVDAPVPVPVTGEVLVRSVLSGVCGSDTHALHGRHPNIPLPYAPGHEVVGVVEALGDDVRSVRVGDRVTVEPTLPCWNCKQCAAGRENVCENLMFFGCVWSQGGMADYFTIPANRLFAVPDDLDDVTAALIEPLSTPVHAARLAGRLEGKAVAILGAGTIGLLMLATVRHAGARRVVVSDVLESKRALARSHRADAVVDAAAPDAVEQVRSALGESADVVFDCVATQSTVLQGVDLARKGGSVVVVGVPSSDVTMPLPVIQDQQIRIQGSATYLREDYLDATQMLRDGAVDVDAIISGRFHLADAAEAFAAATGGQHVKVLLQV